MIEQSQWLKALMAQAGYRVGTVSYFSDPPDKIWRLDEEIRKILP
jgi:hypothetical protein